MNNKILFLLFAFAFISCGKIQLDGMNFYTVKGKIIDVNSQTKPNIDLDVYVRKGDGGYSIVGQTFFETVIASSKTNQNGDFKITFPKSDGEVYLLLPLGYGVVDSIAISSRDSNLVKLKMNDFNDSLLDIKTIKIKGL